MVDGGFKLTTGVSPRAIVDRSAGSATVGTFDRTSGSRPSPRARTPLGRRREKASMLASDPPLCGEELLSAVTKAMVALHERYYHRTPVSAKTRMLGDDLLACVLGGVYTEVEQTM